MTVMQEAITIGIVVLGTQFTRWIAFFLFPSHKPIPDYIQYMGKVLPSAIFGMLVIYCYKNVNFLEGYHGVPELLASSVVILLHAWKNNMFLSIGVGTILYMVLIQGVF